MISLTRLNGERIAINADLIERAEETPDTVLTLTNGTKYVVSETLEQLLDKMRCNRACVLAAAHRMAEEPDGPGNRLRLLPGERASTSGCDQCGDLPVDTSGETGSTESIPSKRLHNLAEIDSAARGGLAKIRSAFEFHASSPDISSEEVELPSDDTADGAQDEASFAERGISASGRSSGGPDRDSGSSGKVMVAGSGEGDTEGRR